MAEWPKLPRIDYFTDGLMKQIVDERWYRNYNENPYINIQVNQVETCKEMVINGLEYAILANLVVEPIRNYIQNRFATEKGKKSHGKHPCITIKSL